VVRRVSPEWPGPVIWRNEGETTCAPGFCGGLGLEYSRDIGGYVVRVPVGTTNRMRTKIYVARDGYATRLIATEKPVPGKPTEYKVRGGVAEFNGHIASATVVPGTRRILITVVRPHVGISEYVVDVPADWRAGKGRVRAHKAAETDKALTKPGPAADKMTFHGCGSDLNFDLAGVWATKQGTFAVAITQAFSTEHNGRLVYGGVAQCLYEVLP
jgi:hypothetical protein